MDFYVHSNEKWMDWIVITNYLIFSEIMRERWSLIVFLPIFQSMSYFKKSILEEVDSLD